MIFNPSMPPEAKDIKALKPQAYKNHFRLLCCLCLLMVQTFIVSNPCVAAGSQYIIEKIRVQNNPNRISIKLNRKPSYNVFQIDKNEVFIIFKNVEIAGSIEKNGALHSFIEDISMETLKGNVTALLVKTSTDLEKTDSEWDIESNTLIIDFFISKLNYKTETNSEKKNRKNLLPDKSFLEKKEAADIPFQKSPVISKNQNIRQADITGGILNALSNNRCSEQTMFKAALEKIRKTEWENAVSSLNTFLETNPLETCRDTAVFLNAYCLYKKADSESEAHYQKAINFCQNAINIFPDSKHVPYGMAILGMIYLKQNAHDIAKGYYKSILKKYPNYKDTPEILFRLGYINAQKKKYEEAIDNYNRILSQYPKSIFVENTRLELGKALFEVNHFSEALVQLNTLLSTNPQRFYESPELLIVLGNIYYHTGKYKDARKTLEKAYNLFPEMNSNHIILTRIADTLSDEKQIEKAKKLYRLVTEKYPGTDGFIISSIRLAKFYEKRADKENIYKLIVKEYPKNPMANLARLRIAEIQNKAHEYEKSLTTINEILSQNPRKLKKEALFLKREALEAVFKEMLGKGDFLRIIKKFETDKAIINNSECPELFYLVGQSYYQGHLYEKAEALLTKADKFSEKSSKPGKLNFILGVALQESGKPEKAFKYLMEYVQQHPEGEHSAKAFRRIAWIQMKRDENTKASKNFSAAFKKTSTGLEKAGILIEHSKLEAKNKQYAKSAGLIIKAINILNANQNKHNAMISYAYETLGKTYMNLKSFQKAADAFSLAIQLSEEEAALSLRFMLGESLHKGNNSSKAAEIYKIIIDSGDIFWGKLAEEKLNEITLLEKIKKHEA